MLDGEEWVTPKGAFDIDARNGNINYWSRLITSRPGAVRSLPNPVRRKASVYARADLERLYATIKRRNRRRRREAVDTRSRQLEGA